MLVLCLAAAMAVAGVGAEAQAPPSAPPARPSARPAASEFEALRRRADEARTGGRTADAIELYERAVALQPSWTEGYWHLGTIYYSADRYRECRDAFARVVRAEPEHGAAWAFRGLCEFRLGEYAPALDHLARAEDLGVGDDPAFLAVVGYHRALLLSRSGQFERAFEVSAGFVRGGNAGPEIVEALGIAMLRLPLLPSDVPPDKRRLVELAGRAGVLSLGMNKDATERAFRELVSSYPDAPDVHYLYGTYLSRERPAEGIEQYRIELARSPRHVPALVQMAQELVKQSDFEGATPYAEQAARLAPDNFLARKVHGQVKLQAGDVAGAIVDLEAARTLEPKSPSVRYQLARAYQRAGRAADADRERAEFKRLEKLQQLRRGAAPVGEETPTAPASPPHR